MNRRVAFGEVVVRASSYLLRRGQRRCGVRVRPADRGTRASRIRPRRGGLRALGHPGHASSGMARPPRRGATARRFMKARARPIPPPTTTAHGSPPPTPPAGGSSRRSFTSSTTVIGVRANVRRATICRAGETRSPGSFRATAAPLSRRRETVGSWRPLLTATPAERDGGQGTSRQATSSAGESTSTPSFSPKRSARNGAVPA